MASLVIPCYGGPKDGKFLSSTPLGYRKFTVRGKIVWLWKQILVEYIDYDLLEKASMLDPMDYKHLDINDFITEEDHA